MERIADFAASLITNFAAVFVVCLFISRKLFSKFLFLNLYLLLSVTAFVVGFVLLDRSGPVSNWYRYSYFVGEMLMMTFLFLAICELSWRLFGDEIPRREITTWGSIAFTFAVLLSFRSPEFQSGWENVTSFCWTLSQNLFFVCCFAIVVLWLWRLRSAPENHIAVQFLNVLLVYFLVTLFLYMPKSTVPHHTINNLFFMLTAWVPLGCGFALASYHQPQKVDI